MMTFNEFKDKWNSMAKIGGGFLRIDSEHPLDINIGYTEGIQKSFYILDKAKAVDLPSTKSIIVSFNKVENGKGMLSFRLTSIENDELFMRLCWDISESSREVHANAMGFVIKRYQMWQKLLTQTRPDILPAARQKGLLGEVTFLREMIGLVGSEKAVESWAGPEGSDQDFIYDDTWTEVKTTLAAADMVTISSLEQLDSPFEGNLVVYRIEKTTLTDTNGITLNKIIKEVKCLLSRSVNEMERFDLKLYMYGYEDLPEYDKTSYKYVGKACYMVHGMFPRLLRSNVPSGVCHAKYDLDLAVLEQFRKL